MSVAEAMKLALSSMRYNKMRSLLTLLGIIIGISSVITILTIGSAVKSQVTEGFSSLGVSDIQIHVQERPSEDPEDDPYKDIPEEFRMYQSAADEDSQFNEEFFQELKDQFPNEVRGVSVSLSGAGGDAIAEGNSTQVSATGVNGDYFYLGEAKIAQGRGISAEDVKARRNVLVLSPEAVGTLFGGNSGAAIGAEVDIDQDGSETSYSVVGVTEKKEQGGGMFDVSMGSQATVYVPYTALDEGGAYTSYLSEANVRLDGEVDREETKAKIQRFLDAKYRTNADYMATINDFKGEVDEVSGVINKLSMAVAAISGISLLVGGIGVMNIMLVTVTERTREIGVRKALGARRRDIRLQFVIEAMIISLFGGLIGLLLGGVLGMIVAGVIGKMVLPPITAVLFSLLFSMGIGIFFGYYPANKAAKFDPIEALRYE